MRWRSNWLGSAKLWLEWHSAGELTERINKRRHIVATDETTKITGAKLGEYSPDWVLPLLDGGELSVGALRGKKAVLFFWGSW